MIKNISVTTTPNYSFHMRQGGGYVW